MESIMSDSSTSASVEAPSATPAPVADSTTAADANQQGLGADPNSPAQQPSQSGETVAGSQDEFPDDQTFSALPGNERASNWQRVRARIGELNQKNGELSEQVEQFSSFKPVAQAIDQMGGWESVEPVLQLATNLFAPVVDEQGQHVTDPQTGLPQYTAEPFVESLAEQSLGTLSEILWHGFDTKFGEETLGHWLMRHRLGLDPNMLTVYQQIQSPEQAREYVTKSGGIDPAFFDGVNTAYHDTLRSLLNTRPALRGQWESLDDNARSELLEDHKFLLENRKYAEEQRQRDEQTAQERAAAGRRQIEEAAGRAISEADDRVRSAQLAKLKQTATFFADAGDNADVWDDILSRSAQDVLNDQTLKPSLEAWRSWQMQLASYDAARDRLKASQARVEISKLERKLEKAFGDRVTERTGQWSRRLGGARAVQQQQIQDAKPRIEIGSTGDNSSGTQSPVYSPPPQGQRFGMSEERKIELARELAARRHAGG
jgi:hypothetical protein